MHRVSASLGRETRLPWTVKCWQLIQIKVTKAKLNEIH